MLPIVLKHKVAQTKHVDEQKEDEELRFYLAAEKSVEAAADLKECLLAITDDISAMKHGLSSKVEKETFDTLAEHSTNGISVLQHKLTSKAEQKTIDTIVEQSIDKEYEVDYAAECMAAAMSGDMALVLQEPPGAAGAEDISVADLNAAVAGEIKRIVRVHLEDSLGNIHVWANFTPVLTSSETVTDVDVTAPTIAGTPKFVNGVLEVEITWITDEDVTMHYIVGDATDLKIQTKADDTLLGWAVAFTTKTFDGIA